MPRTKDILLGTMFILVCTLAVYIPAIRAGFIWDDDQYVTDNPTLRDTSGLIEMWTQPTSLPQWYPMVHMTFWIEYHIWGLWPMGYHLDNVLLHIAAALLLWRLLTKLQVPGAWLAAAIFALHPVQVESVAWVTERKNVLSAVLALSALLMYLKWDEMPRSKSWGTYGVALFLFVAALLSKTVVATLPATILVIFWWKLGKLKRSDVLPLIPFFIIGITLGLFTAYLEVHRVGASGERIAELNLDIFQRILIAGRAVWFYAGKLVFPHPLVFIYPQWNVIDWTIWWQWVFPVGVVLVLVALVLSRKRIGRGAAAGVMIFCGTLFPALGFLNVYPMRFSYVADHFQYHASMALIALIGAALCMYTRKYGRFVLLPLALLTLMQTPIYSDAETLWRRTLEKNQSSWMVHTNLGKVLIIKGEKTGDETMLAEADANYETALKLAPEIHDTHVNFGMSLGRRGQDEAALNQFEQALKINPTFAPAYYGMGQIYQRQKNFDKAIECYRKALADAPKYSEPNFRLGLILEQQGNLTEAVEHYRTAVGSSPENANMRLGLGVCLIRLRQFPEAVYNLMEAVRIQPGWAEAWTNLGAAQLGAGYPQDAVVSFQMALKIKPGLQPAQLGLAQSLSRLSR